MQRVGAMEAARQAAFEGGGASVQFGEPGGEAMRGGAQLFEPTAQPGGASGQPLRAVFEAGAARGEAAEGAVQFGRDVADAAHLLVLGGEDASQQPLLLCHPLQGGVAASGSFEFGGEAAGAAQGLAAQAGKQGVEFDFQGEARTGGLLLAGGEALGAGGEASEGVARLGPAGGGTFERGGEQPGSRTRPCGARAEHAAAGRRRARARRAAGGRRRLRAAGRGRGRRAGRRPGPRRRVSCRSSAAAGRRAGSEPGRSRRAPAGRAAMRRWARASRASRRGVVIGPWRAATTISKGASQPGPTARSIASALRRAGLELGSSLIPGAPVLKARAGAARRISGSAISATATAGRRRAAPAAAAIAERRRSGWRARRPIAPGVDPLAEQREQGGQRKEGDRDGDRGDDDERRRQGEEQRAGLQERGEEDRDEQRGAGEERRAAGGGARGPRGLPRRGACGQLLTEAGDDEEGVVDAEGEAHHRADDHREGFDRHHGVEQDEDSAPSEDGEGTEGKWDRGGDQRAEDEQEHEQKQRCGDQLGALGRLQRFGLQVPGDAGIARLDRFEGRVDAGPQGAFEGRHRLTHGDVERQVVIEEDDRPTGAGAQVADGAAVPGRDDGDGRVAAKRADQRRPLAFDRRGRAAEEDGEGRGGAKVLFGERLTAGGGGAGDDQRGRLEQYGTGPKE